MAKEQANYPASKDVLDTDRVAGQDVTSTSYDIIEDAITEMQAEMRRVTAKTTTATLTSSEGGFVKVTAASAWTLGLPPASGDLTGLTYFIVKTDANSNLITIDANASETINGAFTYVGLQHQWNWVIIRLDGSNWVIMASSIGAHEVDFGAFSAVFTEQALTSGTAIAWDLGNSNKAILTAAHNFTITITAPSGAMNAQLIVTQDGTGSRVMDEIVTQSDAAIATTDVHSDTEIIDLSIDIPTGARIRFKTTAADLPDPLVVDTIYWAIRSSENHIKVATTRANAIAGTAINLTDTGTGTHTVQQLVKWIDGTLGILTTDAGAEDIISLTYKTADEQWYAILGENFS
ncbi:MAG: hypothetical protein E3J83_03555 [Candidatus Atribacteria bacterium]|nr:MAG: hypothetical protein E3J83_03555 [Candidatus Atribacteria bacterium]